MTFRFLRRFLGVGVETGCAISARSEWPTSSRGISPISAFQRQDSADRIAALSSALVAAFRSSAHWQLNYRRGETDMGAPNLICVPLLGRSGRYSDRQWSGPDERVSDV